MDRGILDFIQLNAGSIQVCVSRHLIHSTVAWIENLISQQTVAKVNTYPWPPSLDCAPPYELPLDVLRISLSRGVFTPSSAMPSEPCIHRHASVNIS